MLRRYWINAPSRQSPLHQYHGRNVLAHREKPIDYSVWTCYFTSGPVVSIKCTGLYLSNGWLQEKKEG